MAYPPDLRVENLTVIYGNGHKALDNVGFRLRGGTLCALIGVNGGGKSTLFKSLLGMIAPAAGRVTLNDLPIGRALRQNRVAYVPQAEEVDWDFPVLATDVVMMGRYGRMSFLRIPSAHDKQRVDQALARVGMGELRHRQIGQLSGGQRKRVFLARALAQEGSVILLDEPFTGVDAQTENALIALLRSLRDEGHLILLSTHDLAGIPAFCDEVIMINRTLTAAGPVSRVFTESNLNKTFGGAITVAGTVSP
ncbi:metal ABC transporter ATP-binding protein [Martelella alba]|uniref:Metal ABC transporter ATP-binding protein n=2 Tax=Martelella alba TaxID=2590451 RepID=A0ABY2SGB4_9HYPH|nr:metal ABC transporter ATP-binding protein [Martelella alba]